MKLEALTTRVCIDSRGIIEENDNPCVIVDMNVVSNVIINNGTYSVELFLTQPMTNDTKYQLKLEQEKLNFNDLDQKITQLTKRCENYKNKIERLNKEKVLLKDKLEKQQISQKVLNKS